MFGLIPGIATAMIHFLANVIHWGEISFFFLCVIAEVILICLLKPAVKAPSNGLRLNRERDFAVFISVLGRLMLLYIAAFLTASVLGGLIEFIHFDMGQIHRPDYSAPGIFRGVFSETGLSTLTVNILSRLPINIIDRFIVIFGGYFLARFLVKFRLFSS